MMSSFFLKFVFWVALVDTLKVLTVSSAESTVRAHAFLSPNRIGFPRGNSARGPKTKNKKKIDSRKTADCHRAAAAFLHNYPRATRFPHHAQMPPIRTKPPTCHAKQYTKIILTTAPSSWTARLPSQRRATGLYRRF